MLFGQRYDGKSFTKLYGWGFDSVGGCELRVGKLVLFEYVPGSVLVTCVSESKVDLLSERVNDDIFSVMVEVRYLVLVMVVIGIMGGCEGIGSVTEKSMGDGVVAWERWEG